MAEGSQMNFFISRVRFSLRSTSERYLLAMVSLQASCLMERVDFFSLDCGGLGFLSLFIRRGLYSGN